MTKKDKEILNKWKSIIDLNTYKEYLVNKELSNNTIKQYIHIVNEFLNFSNTFNIKRKFNRL